jgi:low affinity Fe/Cu permease
VARQNVREKHALAVGQKLPPTGISHWFSLFSQRVSVIAGSPWAFIAAVALIIGWLLSGPIFGFSDSWQLIANTVTTLTTTLMVFLIQNTQNRDAKAIHLKLDELLRANPRARNEFMEAEEEDLDEIEREKEIVDQADPAPPAHKKEERAPAKAERGHNGGHALSGNGKSKGERR